MAKLARALALLVAAATACSTFGETPPASDGGADGADASIQPPADGGGDSTPDGVAVADVVNDVVNDYAGCVSLANIVTDGFDRMTVAGGAFTTSVNANGGTLAAELSNVLEGTGSLKVAFQSGASMEAYVGRQLDTTACNLTLSFLLRAGVLPDAAGTVTLATIFFDASSTVRLVLKASGELVVAENNNPVSVSDVTLGMITKATIYEVKMSVDTVAGEVGWGVGPKDAAPTTSGSAKLQSPHVGPHTLHFGGTDAESPLPFDYIVDRFTLK